ncbi:MAG: prepilin-type N-terminal cleavage/methylation domain-containing protein [Nitrospirae bacterium]|nr:prepilin-type N-terminal cleavage/methylation domain-containing protein [Nitrospirota bacterium]
MKAEYKKKQQKNKILNFSSSVFQPSAFSLQPSASGFTLIEVLVSITLLTVVLGAVYGSFFSVQRALERFDNVSLKYHDARTALDLMRREIESALLKDTGADTETGKGGKTDFIIKDRDLLGKSTSILNFTAFSLKSSTANTILYYVEEKDEKLDLLKKEAPSVIKAKEYTMEIVEGIEGFTVESLFNGKWVKTWDTSNTGKIPDMLKISIEFDDNGKKVKLTEFARPKIGKNL